MPNNKVLSHRHFIKLVNLFDQAAQAYARRKTMRPDDAKEVSKKYYQLKDALTNYVIRKTAKPLTAKLLTAKPLTAKPLTAKPLTVKPLTAKAVNNRAKEFFVERTLLKDECFEQWIVPAGTVVKEKESTNFLFTVLPDGCKDARGFVIPKRIFKY